MADLTPRDANINLQMNYWISEMTGLSDLTLPLFNYIEVNLIVIDYSN